MEQKKITLKKWGKYFFKGHFEILLIRDIDTLNCIHKQVFSDVYCFSVLHADIYLNHEKYYK